MLLALHLATLALLAITLLPLWHHPHWLIRGLDFPRLQYALAAITLLIAQSLLLNLDDSTSWLLMSITILCLCWHLWWILPYTPLWPREVQTATGNEAGCRLSMFTSNVLTSNRNAEELLALISRYKPDILVTLESDSSEHARAKKISRNQKVTAADVPRPED